MSSLLLTLGNMLVPEGNKLRIHLAIEQVKLVEHINLISLHLELVHPPAYGRRSQEERLSSLHIVLE